MELGKVHKSQHEAINSNAYLTKYLQTMPRKQWYAIYVRSRYEKKVYARLTENNIIAYLPLVKTMREWSDRKKKVEIVLFSSYVFVWVDEHQFAEVLHIDGAVKFIKFEKKPTPIPDEQIANLKLLLNTSEPFEILHDIVEPGDDIEVYRGSLKGFRGKLVSYKGKQKAMLRIEAINHSILIEIAATNIKKIPKQAL